MRRRRYFLAVLSAGIILLFIVLPLWLLFRRSSEPPGPESFGPASSPTALTPASPDSDDEKEKPVRFR
jgi:hypothetical protein